MVDRKLEHDINELIRMMHDSVDGYAKAAELAESENLKTLFTSLGDRRGVFLEELTSLEELAGGEPVDEGSLGAALYRTMHEMMLPASGNRDLTILRAVHEVLERTIKRYETIMSDNLTILGMSKDILERQHQELLATLAQVNEHISQHEA